VGRYHGKKGRIYMAVASGGTAEPLPNTVAWSVSFATDKADTTAQGDTNKSSVAGLPDASGDFSGFHDDAAPQTYTAATDGVARKTYIYPTTDNLTRYWFGTALFDFKVDSSAGDATKFSGTWAAAGPIIPVGF